MQRLWSGAETYKSGHITVLPTAAGLGDGDWRQVTLRVVSVVDKEHMSDDTWIVKISWWRVTYDEEVMKVSLLRKGKEPEAMTVGGKL